MNAVDWMGTTLAGIGTIGVGAGGEEQTDSSISILHLPWVACIVALLFVLLMDGFVSTDISDENRSWIASIISKMGFISLEQGFSKLVVPICISISACWSASGFVYQTRGLKHGRAIVTSTCAAMASILTGVLAGMLALGDRLPSSPMALLWLCSDGHLLS